jgi:hypothetical protein
MFRKTSKRASWWQVDHDYWEKIVGKILVPGERGCYPSEGEILSAYNEMTARQPECKCKILKAGPFSKPKTTSGDLFQQGDRITGIWIIRLLESTDIVLEFFMSSSELYVCFKRKGFPSIHVRSATCDLQQTMKNFEAFIDNYPAHLAGLEQEKIEFEKRLKIEKMAKLSIKTGVSQVMAPLGYEWDLVDKGEYFTLRIGLRKKKLVEMTLNDKNFTKRIPIIPQMLQNVENFLKNLTFPVDISMNKGLVKL